MITRYLKKKDIRFCPLCAAPCKAQPKGVGAICSACGVLLSVVVHEETPAEREPQVGGHTHRSECLGQNGKSKVCHSSVAEAYARALTLEDIPHRNRKDMQFYECRWCGKIHLGHGGKNRKNVTVAYSYEQAKALYELSDLSKFC